MADASDSQPLNRKFPMVVTFDGIVMVASFLQPAKAASPMVVNVEGSSIEAMAVDDRAPSPISTKFLGSLMVSMAEPISAN